MLDSSWQFFLISRRKACRLPTAYHIPIRKKSPEKWNEGTRVYFVIAATLVTGIAAAFWFLSPLYATFYIKNDPETLIYGIRAARSYAVGLLLYALNRSFMAYLEGRGS